MALNNSDEMQSLVLEVLGQAVEALSLIGETTESPEHMNNQRLPRKRHHQT